VGRRGRDEIDEIQLPLSEICVHGLSQESCVEIRIVPNS
jgi:hypothetical protein